MDPIIIKLLAAVVLGFVLTAALGKVVIPAREAMVSAEKTPGKGFDNTFCGAALELADGRIVTGRNSKLLHAASSCILNAVKLLANLPDNLTLLSPEVIKAVASLKQDVYHNKGISLDLSETLTALSVSSPSNPAAKLALDELTKLKKLVKENNYEAYYAAYP